MLFTNRLTLRELTTADAEKIHELHSLPETDQYNTLGIPEQLGQTVQLLDAWLTDQLQEPRTTYVWAIERPADAVFIGLIALVKGPVKYQSAEVWFKIHKDYWNQGSTTEALISVLYFGFKELTLHRIEAGYAVDNGASGRVLQKAGFTREGLKRKNLPIRGEWKDNYFFGMLEEDFRSRYGC